MRRLSPPCLFYYNLSVPARPYTLRHSLHLILALGWADFKLKYRGTLLGYAWSLIPPLVKFLVILYVFTPFVGSAIRQYPLYLFLGLIIWEHFVLTTTSCISMLREKSSMIQKIAFPRLILVFAVGWTHLLIFASHLIIFFLFAFILHASFAWTVLLLLLIVCQMTLLALGLGMILSSYSLKFQDIRHLWDVLLQVLFWLTPITYPIHVSAPLGAGAFLSASKGGFFPGMLHAFVALQPVSVILFDARRILLYPQDGVPSILHIVVFSALYLVIFLIGARMFMRRSRYFIQEY